MRLNPSPHRSSELFLGNIASGWDVQTDQSDLSSLRLSDLQTAKMDISGTALSATMKHKMGLIGITMAATHTVYDVIYYDGYTYNSTTHSWTEKSRSATSKIWTPSTNFSSTAVPYQIAGTTNLLYIAKPNENNTFNAVIDETNRKYEWYKSGCAVTAANQYVHYDVDSDADYASACWDFEHSNGVVGTWAPLTSGTYEMECWGSQGYSQGTQSSTCGGGYGGYTYGKVYLNAFEEVYVTVGGNNTNGGGSAGTSGSKGGGASDIRYKGNTMYDRIMVAAGGGGEERWKAMHNGGYGGGIEGGIGLAVGNKIVGNETTGSVTGGNQIAGGKDNTGWRNRGSNGTFGYGGTGGAVGASVGAWGGGGGGGYWGGAGGGETGPDTTGGGGGSSFISGHPGCIAIAATGSTSPKGGSSTTSNLTVNRATHFTNLYFTETKMIDGAGYNCKSFDGSTITRTLEQMPNPLSETKYASGRGHQGLGHVRIWFNKP